MREFLKEGTVSTYPNRLLVLPKIESPSELGFTTTASLAGSGSSAIKQINALFCTIHAMYCSFCPFFSFFFKTEETLA